MSVLPPNIRLLGGCWVRVPRTRPRPAASHAPLPDPARGQHLSRRDGLAPCDRLRYPLAHHTHAPPLLAPLGHLWAQGRAPHEASGSSPPPAPLPGSGALQQESIRGDGRRAASLGVAHARPHATHVTRWPGATPRGSGQERRARSRTGEGSRTACGPHRARGRARCVACAAPWCPVAGPRVAYLFLSLLTAHPSNCAAQEQRSSDLGAQVGRVDRPSSSVEVSSACCGPPRPPSRTGGPCAAAGAR